MSNGASKEGVNAPAPIVLTEEAQALIDDIDTTLETQYEKLHVVILLNMQGEIMPCGCSDGVRGGLIKFASLAKHYREQKEPSVFVALGGNHFRTMKPEQYQPFAEYYNQRLGYVDRAIESLTPALKLLTSAEREFLSTLPEIEIRDRQEAIMTLSSGTKVRLSGSSPAREGRVVANDPSGLSSTGEGANTDWTIYFQPQQDTLTGADAEAAIAFGGQSAITSTEGATGRVAILPPPEFGGRDLAHLTLYIPKNGNATSSPATNGGAQNDAGASSPGSNAGAPSNADAPTPRRTIRSLGEARAYRSIAARSGDKQSPLIESIRKRWEAMRDEAPILYEYERIVVKLATEDDPQQLDLYFQFQSNEAVHLGGLDSLASADENVQACQPCHAEIVANFKANDPHFRAMETLKREGKDKDKFCVTCHITPRFQATKEAQGFKLYAGVHCESCHVNAMAHAARPNVIKPFAVSEAVCVTCHTTTQHPTFNYKRHAAKVCCNAGKEGR